jgi:hypothetical protein
MVLDLCDLDILTQKTWHSSPLDTVGGGLEPDEIDDRAIDPDG